MFTSYFEIRNWLENFIPLVWGKEELGLSRIENLLDKLGNPHKKFRSIHVAGTSGKGSTAFYIANLLQIEDAFSLGSSFGRDQRSEGNLHMAQLCKNSEIASSRTTSPRKSSFKVGLHTSPHLVDIRERMIINGKLMPMNRFIGLSNEVLPVVADIKSNQAHLTPSYFEILVAMSFLYFAQEKVDFVVVEVGLGGRLDATNVLKPEISVITNVGLDHTELLGNTIKEIAKEKVGIIKSEVPVVTAGTGKALKVIEKAAKEKKASLINISTLYGKKGTKYDIFGYIARSTDIFRSGTLRFVGENALLAVAAVSELGFSLSRESIVKALSQGLPGRFEEIDKEVILDGAHNPDKIGALIRWIKDEHLTFDKIRLTKKEKIKESIVKGQLSIVLVLAFKKGKDWKKMVNLLVERLPVKEVIATEYQSVTDTGLGSAVPAEEIAEYVESICKGESLTGVYSNSQEAVVEGINMLDFTPGVKSGRKLESTPGVSPSLVLVTGSLYLVGEVRTLWYLPDF